MLIENEFEINLDRKHELEFDLYRIKIVSENDLHRNGLDTNIKSNVHDNYFTRVQYLQVTATNTNCFDFASGLFV